MKNTSIKQGKPKSKKQRKLEKIIRKQEQAKSKLAQSSALLQSKAKSQKVKEVDGIGQIISSNGDQSQNNWKNESKQKRKMRKLQQKQIAQQQQRQSEQEQESESLGYNNKQNQEEQIINVEFLISEINEKYYHSIKTIMEKLANSTRILSSEWADTLIRNKDFGNLVDVEEDEDEQEEEDEQNQVNDQENLCYAIISLLPLSNKSSPSIVKSIREKTKKSYESKKHSKYATSALNVSQILENERTKLFLLVNERVVNLPAFVAVNMHKVLVNDLKSSQGAQFLKKSYVLGFSEVEKIKETNKKPNLEEIIYAKFEDYEFLQNSEVWWAGESVHSAFKKTDMQKLYYIMTMEQYFNCVEKQLDKHLIQ